jgi:hypothetical protein
MASAAPSRHIREFRQRSDKPWIPLSLNLANGAEDVTISPTPDLGMLRSIPTSPELLGLHQPSRLSPGELERSAVELGLRQVHQLLLVPDLAADRVAEPGTPAFDYGLSQADLLLQSLRAAQLPQLAA